MTNPTKKMLVIAAKVLAAAAEHDGKIEVFESRVKAWARALDISGNIWMTEALDAVDFHYATSRFSITAADVIDFCQKQPVYSSRDHASDFLTEWCHLPYGGAIEAHTGIQPPGIDLPESMPAAERRPLLIAHLTAWVDENREMLIDAIMKRRWNPVVE